MVINEMLAAWKLWDKTSEWWRARKHPPAESVAARFVRLFETHGVHRNQIPRYFDHGLRLQDLKDDATLLNKLDESILSAACEHFAIRREWLDSAELQAHPCHDFYKHPQDFNAFIKGLRGKNPEVDLRGVLIAPLEKERHADALLILEEPIGFVGDKQIYRYHLCHGWAFSYWKARAYLTACIAIAWKSEAFVHGRYAPNKEIELISEGEILLGWQGEGMPWFGSARWDPEDMALLPAAFLNGIDPERDNFGITAGLRLWLDLEAEGLMDIGLEKSVRPLFETELNKYEIRSKSLVP